MGNMEEKDRVVALPEPLHNEAEDAVSDHVQGVQFPGELRLAGLSSQPDKHRYIKEDLQFPIGPAQVLCARDNAAEAAAAFQAVNAGAQQCRYDENHEDVKHIRRLALKELRSRKVENGHKEDGSKKAHGICRRTFQEGKDLHAEHTCQCMDNCQQQCHPLADLQPFLILAQPKVAKHGGNSQ